MRIHFIDYCHFRCQEVSVRKEYVNLVENVRDAGGEVKIFSSMHISGQRKHSILFRILLTESLI